jgi:hypothetical protein
VAGMRIRFYQDVGDSSGYYQENNISHRKTHEFLFPIENKQVIREIFSAGNDLETS